VKLSDLDAHFMRSTTPTIREGVGVVFDCPVHRGACGGIYVPFANPLDGGPPSPNGKGCAWQRTGDTIDTLTLTPSVDASAYSYKGTPCWHGFVRNGRIE
jgi:hypothetical protein